MTEVQKNERLVRLARFILSRLVGLAACMQLMWVDLDTGVAMFRFEPSNEQAKRLISAIGGAK